MKYFIYILKSTIDGSLYTGQTIDLVKRIDKHNKGMIKSTKSKIPYKLCYFEEFETRADAMWREWELKNKWNTDRKRKLIKSFDKRNLENLGI